jgi:hypothetical protein
MLVAKGLKVVTILALLERILALLERILALLERKKQEEHLARANSGAASVPPTGTLFCLVITALTAHL